MQVNQFYFGRETCFKDTSCYLLNNTLAWIHGIDNVNDKHAYETQILLIKGENVDCFILHQAIVSFFSLLIS